MKQAPSIGKRASMRAFVRSHPDAAAHLGGRKVNDLTMKDLEAIAMALAAITGTAPTWNSDNQDDDQGDDQGDARQDDDQDKPKARTKAKDKGDDQDEQKLAGIRDLIMNGGFTAADPALRKLIADANKPAEIIEVPTTSSGPGKAITHAKPTNIEAPWGKLFSVKGALGKRTSRMWDGAHPDTPAKDDGYIWPQPATAIALTQFARGQNVFMHGPAGTGKTAWAMQLAANLGRPFALISCDDQTDAPTLLGMTVPSANGGIAWQDGVLTKAIQTPGCVICIDEPSLARAGALMVMQNVLAYRVLYIAETGRRVPVAKGVVFISCDNTNGTGGGARHGYIGTGRLNAAFLDRFGAFCHVSYLQKDKEAQVIMRKTGCTKELAQLLISAATTTRAKADEGAITRGIGLRRLFSWAEMLTDGIDPTDAFEAAIVNTAAEQDREAITQQCLLTYDKAAVARALDPQAADIAPENTNPTDAGRAAAEDFAQ
jgi:MoxR-like ATPase